MDDQANVDTKEFELPETTYVRDIENRVFQAIVLQVLTNIESITLIEGNLIDAILNRGNVDRVKGIYVEQEDKNPVVNVKVEINISYGISIPEKASEIQNKVSEEINTLTGLHVGCVHVIIKNMLLSGDEQESSDLSEASSMMLADETEHEYTTKF